MKGRVVTTLLFLAAFVACGAVKEAPHTVRKQRQRLRHRQKNQSPTPTPTPQPSTTQTTPPHLRKQAGPPPTVAQIRGYLVQYLGSQYLANDNAETVIESIATLYQSGQGKISIDDAVIQHISQWDDEADIHDSDYEDSVDEEVKVVEEPKKKKARQTSESSAGVIDLTSDSSTSSTETDMVSTPNFRGSRNTSTSTQVVTPSPNRGTSRRRRDPAEINDIIARTERRIRDSPHFGFNPTLAEYLIRILKQVLEGDIVPISVLMCPRPDMDLACGGRGCDNNHSCPTAEILKIFSKALPNHRIEFANPGQPIDNMMVINGRENCVGDDCEGKEKTPMPSESPTLKPTCKPIGRVEGQTTAELINLFAEGVRNLGAHVFIVNHGGWGMYKHFFPFLNRALFVAVCAYGVHLSLYQRRRLAFGRWRTPEIQGYRISQYVKQHSDAIGDVYAQYGTPLLRSIFEHLSMSNTVRFVHQCFLTATIQQAYQGYVQSTRRVYRRLPGFRDYEIARWNEMFAQLQAFYRQHGHTIVPQRSGPLGRWVNNQRNGHGMNAERRAQLNSIDFIWNVLEVQWNEMFSQLKAFKVEHGHTNVKKYSGPLGTWVHVQRSGRNMTAERRALLDSINFDWNPGHVWIPGAGNTQNAQWDEMFSQLKAFKVKHGHMNVPRDTPLGRWVKNQRYRCSDQDRRDRLDAINFDWNPGRRRS